MSDILARHRPISALRRWAPPLVVAAAFVHGLAVSWLKWGGLLVDTGRELQLPQRMLAGETLYSDLRYYYGPLSPYVNMLLYGTFGVRLEVLAWAGIASAALMCLGLYRLSRSFLNPWPSAVIAAAFLYLCAFAHLYPYPIFNFVLPYSYASTYGIVAATWSIHWLVRHVREKARATLLLSAACLTLTALTKMEILLAAFAAHAMFLAMSRSERRFTRNLHLIAYGVTAALVLGVYGVLAARTGPAIWHDNLGSALNPTIRHFSMQLMGLENVGPSVVLVALSAILLGVIIVSTRLLGRIAAEKGQSPLIYALVLGAGIIPFFCSWLLFPITFLALPFIGLGVIVVLAAHWLRQPERRTEWSAHLILWTFATVCFYRILLRCYPPGYGFFLLPPGLVALGILLFDYAPRLIGSSGWPRRVVEVAGVGLFAGSALAALQVSSNWYALHTEEIATQRGRLYTIADGIQAPAVRALSILPSETRVLALPEGAGLVFMSGLRPTPDGMFSYLPIEIYGNYDDARILAKWKTNPPDIVVMVKRQMPEYGYRGFGIDYAIDLYAWVLENYEPITGKNAAFVLMHHRTTSSADGAHRLAPDRIMEKDR